MSSADQLRNLGRPLVVQTLLPELVPAGRIPVLAWRSPSARKGRGFSGGSRREGAGWRPRLPLLHGLPPALLIAASERSHARRPVGDAPSRRELACESRML